jgi:ankyrin repeat protein
VCAGAADNVAKDVDVSAYLRSNYQGQAADHRRQGLEVLLELHAAPDGADGQSLMVARSKEDYACLRTLLYFGAQPAGLSDTPLHAAVDIALDAKKGSCFSYLKNLNTSMKIIRFFAEFQCVECACCACVYLDGLQVLQVLLDTYKYKPAIYHQLNPSLPNSQGNTILHQAMKASYSNRALEIVILLCSYNIDPNHRNASGKLAVECVAGGVKDRRTGYVKGLMKTQGLLRQESSGGQVGHEESREDDDSYEVVRGQPLQDDIRVSAVVVDRDMGANECRSFLRQTIDRMDNFVFNLFDGNASVNEAKKSVTKSGEAVAETGEHKARKVEDESSELKALEAELNREEELAVYDPDNNQQLLLDEKLFDGLEWEVECTAEVWMFLSNSRVCERAKWKLIWQLRQLAGGDWQPASVSSSREYSCRNQTV